MAMATCLFPFLLFASSIHKNMHHMGGCGRPQTHTTPSSAPQPNQSPCSHQTHHHHSFHKFFHANAYYTSLISSHRYKNPCLISFWNSKITNLNSMACSRFIQIMHMHDHYILYNDFFLKKHT